VYLNKRLRVRLSKLEIIILDKYKRMKGLLIEAIIKKLRGII
jgi:hypothetical protein